MNLFRDGSILPCFQVRSTFALFTCFKVLMGMTKKRERLEQVHLLFQLKHCFLLLGKFCGNQNPGTLRTTSNYAFLYFHSDASKGSNGFEIVYESNKDEGRLRCFSLQCHVSFSVLSFQSF